MDLKTVLIKNDAYLPILIGQHHGRGAARFSGDSVRRLQSVTLKTWLPIKCVWVEKSRKKWI